MRVGEVSEVSEVVRWMGGRQAPPTLPGGP